MKRAALYRTRSAPPDPASREPGSVGTAPQRAAAPASRSRSLGARILHDRGVVFVLGIAVAAAAWLAQSRWQGVPRALTQDDVDAAVLHTLVNKDLPSRATKAAEAVRPAVVRVQGFEIDPDDREIGPKQAGVGSGVVIMEDGTILTNLHVVTGARKLTVTFFDGTESDVEVVGVRPENDLAIIKPKTLPDDLQPAVLGGTQNLMPGDEVVAVGFPFGMGPSVSAGVVSGLNREFRTEGKRVIGGLIQFDAAANPGNSGGPLVNMSGEVVGIVTAILNPTSARTFIGIGFATTIESAGNSVGIPPF